MIGVVALIVATLALGVAIGASLWFRVACQAITREAQTNDAAVVSALHAAVDCADAQQKAQAALWTALLSCRAALTTLDLTVTQLVQDAGWTGANVTTH